MTVRLERGMSTVKVSTQGKHDREIMLKAYWNVLRNSGLPW